MPKSINLGGLLRGILIGSTIFFSSTILIITIYLLYCYCKESFNYHENFSNGKVPIDFNPEEDLRNQRNQRRKSEEKTINSFISFNSNIKSNIISSTPTFIEELMRKSLELAKTAEKIADEKEKRISLKDKILLDSI